MGLKCHALENKRRFQYSRDRTILLMGAACKTLLERQQQAAAIVRRTKSTKRLHSRGQYRFLMRYLEQLTLCQAI